MPASIISAPTGGRPKVIGKSIATVATVPMPGKTPTSVPTSAPSRQNRMFCQCDATWKPIARFASSSDMTTSRFAVSVCERSDARRLLEHQRGISENIHELVAQDHVGVGLRPKLERQIQKIDEQPDAQRGHDRRRDQAFEPLHF